MPTYDYRCGACGHEFELFQSMRDKPKRKCPECKKNALERLIGLGGAVLFKGTGFYETDYRSDSYKAGAKSAASSKSDTAKADVGSCACGAKPAAECASAANGAKAKGAKKDTA